MVAILARGHSNIRRCVSTSALVKSQASSLLVPISWITEWSNMLLLLARISRQQYSHRTHQRTNNVHCECAISKTQFFSDQRIGHGLDCARPTKLLRKGRC